MQTELATGAAPVEKSVDKSTVAFENIVADSKRKIAATTITPASERRGRGRPVGWRKNQDTAGRPSVQPAAAAPPPPPVETPAPAVAAEPPPDLMPILMPMVSEIGKIPARRTGFAELALTPDEAGAIAHSLSNLVHVLVPDFTKLDPKSAAILGFTSTVGVISYGKYAQYLDIKLEIERNRAAASQTAEKINPPKETVTGGVDANNYFNKTI